MSELDSLRSSVSQPGSSLRGIVTIGTTPTIAAIVTAALVRKIRDAHPQLSMRFTSAFSGHLLDWVQRGELDLAVSYDPQPLKSLRITPVMVEELLLVGRSDAGLRLDQPVRFTQLASEPLILPSPGHRLRGIIDECARRAEVAFDASLEANSFEVLIDLVRNGFGPTILPLAPIHALVQQGVLCAAPIVDPAPTRTLVLVFPADRAVSPAARFAAQSFLEIAADLVARDVWAGRLLSQEPRRA